jgi:hypothetical protein
VKKRTGAERVKAVEAKRLRDPEITATVAGSTAPTADADVLAFLDGLLAEGRALVRSRGCA